MELQPIDPMPTGSQAKKPKPPNYGTLRLTA